MVFSEILKKAPMNLVRRNVGVACKAGFFFFFFFFGVAITVDVVYLFMVWQVIFYKETCVCFLHSWFYNDLQTQYVGFGWQLLLLACLTNEIKRQKSY